MFTESFMSPESRKIALYVSNGIELRTYFNASIDYGENTVYAFHDCLSDDVLRQYAKPSIEFIKVSRVQTGKKTKRLYYYLIKSARRYQGFLGIRAYNPGKYVDTQEDVSALVKFSNKIIIRFLKNALNLLIGKESAQLKEQLSVKGVTDVVLCGYSGLNNYLFSDSALRSGARIWSIVNGWKDIYVDGIVLLPLTGLFVWNPAMLVGYESLNPELRGKVIASGHPRFSDFTNIKPEKPVSAYFTGENNRKIVYTCANPEIVADEEKRIHRIYEALAANSQGNVDFLVKMNPMDSRKDYLENYFKGTGIIFYPGNWVFDRTKDLNIPGVQDEQEWKDIVYYTDIFIGAASTVAVEAFMAGKPVVNITFDEEDKPCAGSLALLNAPYYKALIEDAVVVVAESLDSLVVCVEDAQGKKNMGL